MEKLIESKNFKKRPTSTPVILEDLSIVVALKLANSL